MIVIYFLFLNSFSISPPSENLHRAVFTNEIIPNSPHVEQSSTQNRLLTTDQAKTSQDPSVLDGLVKFPDQSYWSVLGSSEIADNNHEGPAKYLLDDKNNTFWHSDKNQTGSYYFIINLKYAMKIGGFAYVPRPSGANGLFKDYKFFIGSSIEDVRNKITNNGTSTNEGRFSYTNDEGDHSRETHYVRLADEVETSFVGLSSSGTGGFGSCAEFLIYVKPINSFVGLEKIADRSNWELTESSELVNNGHEGPVEYLIDGNNNTFWHSFLSTEGNYHYFIINLKYKATISGFEYQPRPVGANGLFKDYQFFTGFSKDEIMDKFKSNSFAKEGQFKYADTTSNTSNHVHETQYVRLDNDIECSFVGLRSKGNNGFASCAEFNLYVKHKNGLYGLEKISDRSDWTVISNSELSQTGNEGPAQNILDNNSGTTWHSASMSENSSFYFIVNMKYCISISGFQYIPRSSEANGVFVNYKFFTGKSYDEILNKIKHHDQGTSTIEGVFIYPELTGNHANDTQGIRLPKDVECSFVALWSNGTNNFGSCAEFNIYIRPNSLFNNLEPIINRNEWNITANSVIAEDHEVEGPVRYLVDGNKSTFWHSSKASEGTYHYFLIELQYTTRISAFSYVPRPTGTNGLFKDYQFFTGFSYVDIWRKINNGNATKKGNFVYSSEGVNEAQLIRLPGDIECSFVALRSKGTGGYGSCADFDLFIKPEYHMYGYEQLNRANWVVNGSSQMGTGKEGPVAFLKDGDKTTFWHSQSGTLHYFIIDLNEPTNISGFQYVPRQKGTNGIFQDYKLYAGSSKDDILNKITSSRETIKEGHFTYKNINSNSKESQYIRFNQVTCRFVALSSQGTGDYGSCAEFYLYVKPGLYRDAFKTLDRENWTIEANSYQNEDKGNKEGPVHFIKDTNKSSLWHSRYNTNGSGPTGTPPFYFTIDLPKPTKITAFEYVPRQTGVNGLFVDFQLFTGDTCEDVRNKILNNETAQREGTFFYKDIYTSDSNSHADESQYVLLNEEIECSCVALYSLGNFNHGSCAEFYLFQIPSPADNATIINVSEMDRSSDGWNTKRSNRYFSTKAGAYITARFFGTQFWIEGTLDPGHGEYTITIDGINQSEVFTQKLVKRKEYYIVYESSILENDYHEVTITSREQNKAIEISSLYYLPGEAPTDTPSETESETETESLSLSQSESETESKIEIETEIKTEIETESKIEIETEIKTEIETESKIEIETEIKTAIETEIKTEIETETEIKTAIETEIKTEIETEIKTAIETEIKTEIETEIKTAIETEIKTEIETEIKTEKETEIKTEIETEIKTEIETETEIKTEVETEIKTEIETESESQAGTKTEKESQSELETGKDTNTESKSEFETLLKSEPEKDSNSETKNTIEEVNPGETHSQSKLVDPPTAIQPSLPIHYTLDNAISIDTTNSHVGLESNISTDSKELTNKNNIGLIAGITVGGIAFIAIVILLILFFLYRKRKADASNFSDVTIEMDEGALNIIQTNNDMNDDDYVSNNILNSDFIENPFVENENQDSNQHYSDNFISDLDE